MTGTRRAVARAAGVGLVLAAAACSGVDDPSAPFAVEFARLPWPSIIVGDTLRDSTGAAARLTALVLDADGVVIPSAAVTFVALDTGIRVLADGRVVSTGWRETPARVVASVDGLQSRPLSLIITRRPDSLQTTRDTAAVLAYDIPPTDATNLSATIPVRLRSRQVVSGVTGDSVTRGWLVRFTIAQPPTAGVVDSVRLVGKGTTAIPASGLTTFVSQDTSDASGVAAVRVRAFPRAGQTGADSVIVQASAVAGGRAVPGSPVRLVVRLRRRTVTP